MIKLVTFVARAEPDVELVRVLRESDRVPTAASPVLFPKDSFHLLCFFVTEGIGVDTGMGGEGGASMRKDWVEAVVERVWRLSSRTSV